MGYTRSDPTDWKDFTTKVAAKPVEEIFSHSMDPTLDPRNIKVRESIDSAANPESTPLILAVDQTGSMGKLSKIIVEKDLPLIMAEVYDRKPITDPHICCMAFGDALNRGSAADGFEPAPLQVTQFEPDIKLAEQMTKFWLVGQGGGNLGESYNLPWYFANFHVVADSQRKRNRKGYLFTIGDEPPLDYIPKDRIKNIFNDEVEKDYTSQDLLKSLAPNWHVFHLIVKPTARAIEKWKELLNERAILVEDHTKLGEVIVSAMQVIEGHNPKAVIDSWSGDTSLVVAKAIKGLVAGTGGGSEGVVRT